MRLKFEDLPESIRKGIDPKKLKAAMDAGDMHPILPKTEPDEHKILDVVKEGLVFTDKKGEEKPMMIVSWNEGIYSYILNKSGQFHYAKLLMRAGGSLEGKRIQQTVKLNKNEFGEKVPYTNLSFHE